VCSQELADQLRQLGEDERAVDVAAVAMYPTVRATQLRWIDLTEESRDDYRLAVHRVINVLAILLEDAA
jgi:hypothetical protein